MLFEPLLALSPLRPYVCCSSLTLMLVAIKAWANVCTEYHTVLRGLAAWLNELDSIMFPFTCASKQFRSSKQHVGLFSDHS